MHRFREAIRYLIARMFIRVESIAHQFNQKNRHQRLNSLASIHPSCNIGFDVTIINTKGNKADITIGAESAVLGHLATFPKSGKISIGQKCFIGENSRIWSAARIEIGDYVIISHNVNIHDSNSHSLDYAERKIEFDDILPSLKASYHDFDIKPSPIVIENDVWIGFNAVILRGVRIGRGAIIGACTVVTKDVPPFTVVAGNPMRIIQALEEQQIEAL